MAFQPIFTISPRLSTLLTEIALKREKILSFKILPKRESRLVRSARLRMIHSSTAIEGNQLGLRDVEAVLQGKVMTGMDQMDRLEVLNYEKVMSAIDDMVRKRKPIQWERVILLIHKLTTKKLLSREKIGHYRKGPVFIVQQPTQKILYRGPEAVRVPKLMKDLCSWLDHSAVIDISPVIVSAIAHHQLVTIHPFADGNGRTARALATLILYQRGYDIKKMFALDDYYNHDRPAYYQAIRKARRDKNLTSWLEYFAQGVDVELQQVLEKVEHFSREIREGTEPMYLSKRQRDILEFISMNGKIFRSDVVDIASVSPKTAYRELEFMRDAGLLKRKGKGPTSHYQLVR